MEKKMISFLTAAALSITMNLSIIPSKTTIAATTNTNNEITEDNSTVTNITLSDNISISGDDAEYTKNTVTITKAGPYNISSSLNDRQIIVNSSESDSVKIVLSGVNITGKVSTEGLVVVRVALIHGT